LQNDISGLDMHGGLLRTAAVNLGRVDSDTSIYEARLEAEWLSIEET